MRSVGAGGRVHRHREGHPKYPRVRKSPVLLAASSRMLQVESCLPAACSSLPGRAESDQHHVLACAAAGPFLLVSGFCPDLPVRSSVLGSAAAASSPHTASLLHRSTAPLHGCRSEVCRRVGRQPCTDIRFRRLLSTEPCISASRRVCCFIRRTQLCLCCHLCIFASSLSLTILPPLAP
jgi:hypothetical protein